MLKPETLCYLQKDKLIDTQKGFVDTFNWMVDYINNLRGEIGRININKKVSDHPVIELLLSSVTGGSGINNISCYTSEGSCTYISSPVHTLIFEPLPDSNMSFIVNELSTGIAKIQVGTYWLYS